MTKLAASYTLTLSVLAPCAWADEAAATKIGISTTASPLSAPQTLVGEYTELVSSLARINPDLKAASIEVTPMFGIYNILLNSGDHIYMSADGEFFFAGTMYQNSFGEGLVNLTEQGAIKSRRVAMQSGAA
tara:strand:+ start:169 stop:561 length:393 start_codon:yes stop_codon:yes gene_type:complete